MLRDLRETDVKAICEINQEALGYSFSPEDTASHVLLGYVHAEVYESLYSKAGFNILALAISPQAQGQGIGKSLLQGLEQEAKRRGYGFIRLNSADHRLGAHAFYEKVGYTCDKVQKRFIRIF